MSPTKQDLKMRFGEGAFGPYPDYTGPEAGLPGDTGGGAYPMPSTLHPDITDERGQLANTMSQGILAPNGAGTGLPGVPWDVPNEGTRKWQQEVYEPTAGWLMQRDKAARADVGVISQEVEMSRIGEVNI